jgi:F-type H+-transporting ATPase subunit delta
MERLSVLYASALFELAVEKGSADRFLDQAILVRNTLQDADCQHMVVHPHIPATEKQNFFKKAFAGRIHDDLLGFLFLVTEKNRETYLLSALTELISMIERYKGKITATVYFAAPLDKKQLTTMKTVLSKKLNKDVDLSIKIDPTIIGGPYILVDGYYLDWTVKTRLRDLTVYMKEGCSA